MTFTPEQRATALEVLNIVEAQPENFNMALWYRTNADTYEVVPGEVSCGTTMCVAGWVVHLKGWTLHGGDEVSKDGVTDYVRDIAAEELGLTFDQAEALFLDSNRNEAKDTLRALATTGEFVSVHYNEAYDDDMYDDDL